MWGGFPPEVDEALRRCRVCWRLWRRVCWRPTSPATLRADIAAAVSLDQTAGSRRQRAGRADLRSGPNAAGATPGFRERVLRAYEYRCCVCGFDLRIGQV